MKENDALYRAYKEYRQLIDSIPENKAFFTSAKNAPVLDQRIEALTTVCIIDKDWVEEIDKAMPFIADAVAEERQFVRSEGEVVDIEKVRVVGKESVEDLAKHSNYISRKPLDDGRIIPDKLLMPKKDNDYAIYENRFLYSLLVYLSQFIELRLNEILALSGKYQAETNLTKKISTPKRELNFVLKFNDTRYNDALTEEMSGSDATLDIIEKNLTITKSLLLTPLMKSIRNAPPVHPPFTKTNIIKFDNNFKQAAALYDFLLSYDKKGFTVKEERKTLDPFINETRDDFYELIYLTSFLTYEHGSGLEREFEKAYQEEEKRRKEEENQKVLDQIKSIQNDIKRSGLTTEEYVALLEKGKDILEKKVLALNGIIQKSESEHKVEIKKLGMDFAAQEEADIQREKEHQKTLFEEEKVKILAEKVEERKKREQAEDNLQKEKLASIQKVQDAVKAKEEENAEAFQNYDEKVSSQEAEIASLKEQVAALEKEKEDEKQKNLILSGSINAMRAERGEKDAIDFTDKNNFLELEAEKEAFEKFFEKEWKATKKRMRKEMLSISSLKKKDQEQKLEKQEKKTSKSKDDKKKKR